MATYTFYSQATDAQIQSQRVSATRNTTAVQEGTTTGTNPATVVADTTTTLPRIGQQWDGVAETVWETLLSFDTTSLPDDDAIATVTLAIGGADNQSVTDFVVEARLHDWGVAATTADFVPASALGGKTLLGTWNTSTFSYPYNNLVSESAFASAISPTGILRVVLCSDRHRTGVQPSGNEYITTYAAEETGTTTDPKLTIVTVAPAFVRDSGVAQQKTSNTVLIIGPVSGTPLAVGEFVVLAFAMDPASGTVSVIDNQVNPANTWRLDKDVVNGSGTSGVRVCVFSCKIVNNIVSTTDITITHPTAVARGASLQVFSFGDGSPLPIVDAISPDTTGNSGTPSVAATTTVPDTLVVGALGVEGPNGDTFTQQGGWTSNTVSVTGRGTSGGSAATNITVHTGWQFASSAGAKTWAPTITSRLWAAALVAYKVQAANGRAFIATVADSTDQYHASLDYDRATGVVQRAVLEPTTHPGTKRATLALTLGDGTTVRSLSATPPGNDTGACAYLNLAADNIVVDPITDPEGPTYTNLNLIDLNLAS